MLQHIRKPFVAFAALAAVLAMTGCQASGGGTMTPGGCGSPQALATFGFTFQGSDQQILPLSGTLTGTYRDPGACGFRGGVALRGTGHSLPPDSPLARPSGSPAGAVFA